MENNSNAGGPPQGPRPEGSSGGGNNNRRRRYRSNRSGGGSGNNPNNAPSNQNRSQSTNVQQNRSSQQPPRENNNPNRNRRPHGKVLTSNQVLVKYDNLLEQHVITRKKYYEYFNRVDERQLYKLEKNFFDSIEHLRRFEAGLEPWQLEALEKRKTERYRLDLTYSGNHDLDPQGGKIEVAPEEVEDPHFKDTQKEAYVEYREDTEESEGSYEDYLKLKGLT